VRPGGCWVRRVGTVTTDNGVSVHHPRLRRTTSMFGFFSPTRRLRAAFAKQLDQMAQKLNEAVRERDAARMTAKTLAEKLAAKRDEIVNVFNERAAAESKLANADSENARLHRELNAALCRCEELAGKADAARADTDRAMLSLNAATSVRDRAIEDMNCVQELQKAAERKLAEALDRLGKLAEAMTRAVNEVNHVQACVDEWASRVKNQLADEREKAVGMIPATPVTPVLGRGATLTMGPPKKAG
jgi:uncharacterized coiled-coil DUF342 family protein